jgi:hypothetical protein
MLLAGLHLTTLVIRTTRGWKEEGLAEEAKVWFNLFLLLQLLPLQLFQDHRDGDLEAVGMTTVCRLHQAVPSRSQVVVLVRDI